MNKWTEEELDKINTADELVMSAAAPDGALRPPVTIWMVRVGDDLFARAINGPTGKWYQRALETHRGHIEAGGVSRDVTIEEVKDNKQQTIDAAYQHKYNRYGSRIVGTTLTPQAQSATLKIIPS